MASAVRCPDYPVDLRIFRLGTTNIRKSEEKSEKNLENPKKNPNFYLQLRKSKEKFGFSFFFLSQFVKTVFRFPVFSYPSFKFCLFLGEKVNFFFRTLIFVLDFFLPTFLRIFAKHIWQHYCGGAIWQFV